MLSSRYMGSRMGGDAHPLLVDRMIAAASTALLADPRTSGRSRVLRQVCRRAVEEDQRPNSRNRNGPRFCGIAKGVGTLAYAHRGGQC